jgi:hypothetical protein
MTATPGTVRDRTRAGGGLRAVCLLLGLALVAAGCTEPQRDPGQGGVRGGTLRVLSGDPDVVLDSANAFGGPLLRAYARTLYGYDLSGGQGSSERGSSHVAGP